MKTFMILLACIGVGSGCIVPEDIARLDKNIARLELQQKELKKQVDALTDREAELAAMRKIVRYWRDKGVDVTTEGIVQPDFDNGLMGLVPMVWHINLAGWNKGDEFTEADYMEIPASLFCGGEDHSHRALLFGTNMSGEGIPNDQIHEYLPRFCLKTLPDEAMQ